MMNGSSEAGAGVPIKRTCLIFWGSGLAAADGLNNFHALAGLEAPLGMLAARHQLAVDFHREASSHLQQKQQGSQRTVGCQFLFCPVDDDLHVHSLRLRQRRFDAGVAACTGAGRYAPRARVYRASRSGCLTPDSKRSKATSPRIWPHY